MSQVVNCSRQAEKIALSKVICEKLKVENRDQFYSFEVTPNKNLKIDLSKFQKLPLFIDVNWLRDDNLKVDSIQDSPAFQITKSIQSTYIVNSITCYKMTEKLLDEILNCDFIMNLNILRGG